MLKPVLVVALMAATPALAQNAAPAPAATAPAEPSNTPVSADTVVATVGDQTITLGQMIAMKEGMQEDAAKNLPNAALWDLMLDQMIRQTAVAAEKTGKLTAKDNAVMELDRRAYLAGTVLEKVAAADPTEDELKAAYDKAIGADGTPKTEYHAAHILVKTEDEAKAVEADLAKGEDFGKLAEEKSTDTVSAANKGDLNWFQAEQMVAPFGDALKTMKAGEVSKPVQTQFGWHVIKLIETREATPPKFEEVKDQLAVQVRRDRVEAAIASAIEHAKIEKTPGIDPELLNKTDLLGN